MNAISAVASSVGAGVSQVRSPSAPQSAAVTEQGGTTESARAAALVLIQRALSVTTGTTGRDLDVLA